jgi:hypothetical protein
MKIILFQDEGPELERAIARVFARVFKKESVLQSLIRGSY